MQIFYLSRQSTIALFFVLWPLLQYMASFICRKMGDSHFQYDRSIYRTRGWEDHGRIYERFTKVHKWKRFLPDGASIGKSGFKKKHMTSFSSDYLERYLVESCRAELTHWLAIPPFWVFGLFAPPKVIVYMFLYALAVNVPCIIAQRYNRPRMARMLKKANRKSRKQKGGSGEYGEN